MYPCKLHLKQEACLRLKLLVESGPICKFGACRVSKKYLRISALEDSLAVPEWPCLNVIEVILLENATLHILIATAPPALRSRRGTRGVRSRRSCRAARGWLRAARSRRLRRARWAEEVCIRRSASHGGGAAAAGAAGAAGAAAVGAAGAVGEAARRVGRAGAPPPWPPPVRPPFGCGTALCPAQQGGGLAS